MKLTRHIATAATALTLLAGATAAGAATPHSTAAERAVAAAKAQWISESVVGGGALQNISFELVIADLRAAIKDGAGATEYTHAVNLVLDLGSLPDSMLTSAEEKEFLADVASVDKIFGIPSNPWNKGCITKGAEIKAAVKAWAQEPSNAHHGVTVAPLKSAVTDLTKGIRSDTGDRSCDTAAIADLTGLEHATAKQIAAAASYNEKGFTNPSAGQVVDMEVLWLNAFFGINGGDLGSTNRLQSA